MNWVEIASGIYASHPSDVEGPVRVVVGLQAIVAFMKEPEGEPSIIVTNVAGGSAVSTIIRRAKAIVSTIGGPNSHIVVVARDYNVPCIVGAANLDLASLTNGARMRMRVDGGVEVARSATAGPSLDELRLLRLVVFAGALRSEQDVVGFGDGDITAALKSLREAGLVESGTIIAPTPAGSEMLEKWYSADRGGLDEPVRERILDKFRPLDVELKRVCSAWQDAASRNDWDGRLEAIEALSTLHDNTVGFVEGHADVLPRFGEFRDRLARAHGLVLEGSTDYFVGVKFDSYHTIWSQFHEDLLRVLQRERDAE